MKSFQIQSFFWSVFSCIQFEYGEIQTRKNSVFGHFSRGASIHKRNLHDDLYDLCHQYLLRHAHYFHFCNIVVVAPEVVVVAIVAGFAAAFEKNGTIHNQCIAM